MAGLVRGFPNIAVFPDRPPNGSRFSCGALTKKVSFNILRAPGSSLSFVDTSC